MKRNCRIICCVMVTCFAAMSLTSCFGCGEKDYEPLSYSINFEGRGDGYIYQGRNIGLRRVTSGLVDYFPEYKNGSTTYVRVGGAYIRVSGRKFVEINYIDYYGI